MSGDAFDYAYISWMMDDHKEDLRAFKKEADNGTNADIRAFASSNLKMLQIHLDSATSIQKIVGKKVPDLPVTAPPYQ
jgi:putative membrane protein